MIKFHSFEISESELEMETLVEQVQEVFNPKENCVEGDDAPEFIPSWLTKDLIEDALRKGFKDDGIEVISDN